MAAGAVTPRSVRFPSMGKASRTAGGGGGGTLRAPFGGGTDGLLPEAPKTSRSDPLFSSWVPWHESLHVPPTEATTETEVVSWSLAPM